MKTLPSIRKFESSSESRTPKTRLTQQRKTILDVVKATCYHPTAEQIFNLVKKQLPKISIGTIYRNLDILADQQLVKRIDIPGEPVRFDADQKNKAYFVCKSKGAIYDLKIESEKLKSLVDCDCIDQIDNFHILIFGTSKECSSERSLRKGQIKH